MKFTFDLWDSSWNILIQIKLIRIIKINWCNIINIIARKISWRMMIFICSICWTWIFISTLWLSTLLILWRYFLDDTWTVQLFLVLVIECTIMFLEYIAYVFGCLILWLLRIYLFIWASVVVHYVLKFWVACKISYLLKLNIFFVLIYKFKFLL